MDKKKVCFIICVNDNLFFEECVKYIQRLVVPEGVEIELIEVRKAQSMAAGYNEGMFSSDAKYKIYMYQDVFILNQHFIQDIISIFQSDVHIGMIGLEEVINFPQKGIMWLGNKVPEVYEVESSREEFESDRKKGGLWEVEAIDRLLMATQYDIPWRKA